MKIPGRGFHWALLGLPFTSGCYCRPCPEPVAGVWDGGSPDGGYPYYPSQEECAAGCRSEREYCTLESPGVLTCDVLCMGGRAPPGLMALSDTDGSSASWIARMAELEAAAVQAFLHLAGEFDAHGMHRFADGAVVAARDEIRHANEVARLALRLGQSPRIPAIAATPVRTLDEIVIENAREGCGRELFGAEVNVIQATSARDAEVARVMNSIAADERAHADFSFALAESLMPRVSVATRRRAREAQEEALLELSAGEVPENARQTLGLPDAAQARLLAERLLKSQRLS